MGSVVSVTKQYLYWSEEDVEEQKRVAQLQQVAVDYVTKSMYYAVPIRTRKKNDLLNSPIWIEPVPEVIEASILAKACGSGEDPLAKLPTGVLIDAQCNIKILFTLQKLEYVIPRTAMRWIDAKAIASADDFPVPKPPKVLSKTEDSLLVSWERRLQLPTGLVDTVEVQFTMIRRKRQRFHSMEEIEAEGKRLLLDEEEASSSDEEGDISQPNSQSAPLAQKAVNTTVTAAKPVTDIAAPLKPVKKDKKGIHIADSRWNVLVVKYYCNPNFHEHLFNCLPAGTQYRFRLRYHTYQGWSVFSKPSKIYRTICCTPSTPQTPVCSAITCYAVEVHWSAPLRDNGADVYEYVLQGRSVGDEFVELYRGKKMHYLALGLFPENAYTFQVAAVNAIGPSAFSPPVSVFTPPNFLDKRFESSREYKDKYGFTDDQIQTAKQCRDAWIEFWDPKTEQTFYFNTILSLRQLEVPEVLTQPEGEEDEEEEDDDDSEDEDEGENEADDVQKIQASPSKKMPTSSSSPNKASNKATMLPNRATNNNSTSDKGGTQANILNKKPTMSLQSLETDKEFRKKRYQVTRSLHQRKATILSNWAKTLQSAGGSSSKSNKQSNSWKATDVLKIELERKTLLRDFAKAMFDLSNQELLLKWKFSLVGEEAIDSGGVSKEVYLLLSRSLVRYATHASRRWMQYTSSTMTNPNANTSSGNNEEDKDDDSDEKKAVNSNPEVLDGLIFTSPSKTEDASRVSAAAITEKQRRRREAEQEDMSEDFLSQEQFSKLLGIVFGKAMLDRQLIDFPCSSVLLKHILGGYQKFASLMSTTTVSKGNNNSTVDTAVLDELLVEIQLVDPAFTQSMRWMCSNDITHIIEEQFAVEDVSSGKLIPLCARGEEVAVTEENKLHYVLLMGLWKLLYSVTTLLHPFLASFHHLVPLQHLLDAHVTMAEFNLILNGKQSVHIEEIREYCMYQSSRADFHEGHDSVVWLWRAVRDMSEADRRLWLQFVTGSSRVPLDGYDPPILITQGEDMAHNSLPRAHTCFNQLVLPSYSSYDTAKDRLVFAIRNTEGFGMA